jgi:hypothetical protein
MTISRPTLRKVVEWVGKLPAYCIMLGMAKDGLPVLFNAQDTTTKNIVVWDKLARQSLRILQVISEYIFYHHKSDGVEFIVLTLYPEEYGELNKYGMGMTGKTSCIGIIPFGSEIAEKVMDGLARWVNERHNSSKQPIIVLVDGLENVNKMSADFQNHFRYLLDMGRRKHVFIVGTSSKNNFQKVQKWLDGFGSEIYGRDVEYEFEFLEEKNTILFYTPRTEMI